MSAPTQVPAELIAGDTWEWTRELSDYPAGTWTATWYFVKGGAMFSVVGTASGTTHAATVAAATTSAKAAGRYRWTLTVLAAGVRKSVEEGWVEVTPNPAGTAVDPRPNARIVLDNIDAYLADPNNLTAASFTYRERSLARYSFKDLMELRAKMQAEIETQEAGNTKPRRLYARFDRA